MPYETLRYAVDAGGVATIALDQPETRNALSVALLDELIAALEAARADDAVRVVVLASTHPEVFSAGGDLASFVSDAPLADKHLGHAAAFPRLFTLLADLGKPTICAAGGHVLAAGLALALACDLIVARAGVRLGTPEIDVGVFPFVVLSLLYRNVGRKKATELLLLGEQVSAEEAERIGIVNRVVAADGFDAAVRDWAERLAAKSPLLMRIGKDAIRRQHDMAFDEALAFLQAQLSLTFATEDLREGIAAFFEHRDPRWRGR
jgi:enoyl-CoA hydratase/carnithine racemase